MRERRSSNNRTDSFPSEGATLKTAVLITHSHPPAPTEAVEDALEAAAEHGWQITATPGERSKHGDAAAGIEEASRSPKGSTSAWCSAGTARSCTRCAASPAPAFRSSASTSAPSAFSPRSTAKTPGRVSAAHSPGRSRRSTCPASRSSSTDTGGSASTTSASAAARRTGSPSSATRSPARRSGTCAATASSPRRRSARPATTSPTRGRSWPGGSRDTWSATSPPHSLTARALVVAPGDVLHVENAAGREPVDVAVDGEQIGALEPGAQLAVGFADEVARLAQLSGTSFYQRIREKFGHLAV